MQKDQKVSLIIPVYNAEIFILDTLKKVTKWKLKAYYETEVILVNDGSIDLTKNLIEEYVQKKDGSIKFISYEYNKGKGYAVKVGMLEATGDFRIFTDSDIPYGLEIVDNIIYYLDFKEFDVCIGNRKSIKSRYVQEISKLRRLSSKVFTLIISRYVVTGVKDTQCGIKGFRAEIAEKLFSNIQIRGFAFDVEALYYCYKFDYEIKRIPVVFQGNSISTIRLSKVSLQMFWDVFRLPIRYHFFQRNHN
ncbi:glycosyltransferase [Gramella sp. GC03-9]|uniref:Glycosyltransferase n=1 Tax=Christiangramia oceanisediminis TaxID=2920386 RepID=A0A9X2I374_9FLAO|nr:glycosyltransferase [Gramella oceanisediminis]MCP9199880.1 glycosyltransferase [Gramella oceanisediminis]